MLLKHYTIIIFYLIHFNYNNYLSGTEVEARLCKRLEETTDWYGGPEGQSTKTFPQNLKIVFYEMSLCFVR